MVAEERAPAIMDIENGLPAASSAAGAVESTPLLAQLDVRQSYSRQSSISDYSAHSTSTGGGGSIHSIVALPGMKIRAHSIHGKTGAIQVCDNVKEALQNAKAGRGHFWMDIDADARDTQELRAWLAQLKLSSFFKSRLSEPPDTWSSQVIPLPQASLAMIRILPDEEYYNLDDNTNYDKEKDYNDDIDNDNDVIGTNSDEMTHIAALNLPHLLVTFTSCDRSGTGGLYPQFLSYIQRHERIPGKSSSGALLAWLQWHMDRTSRSARRLRYNVLQMDAAMDRDPKSVHIQEIILAKDELLRILSVAEEQVECIEALANAEKDTVALDFSQLRGRIGVLQATAGATARMSLRLEKHLGDLRHRYESLQHDRLNRRLSVLTILSAIFLPLTLLSGIWGMNFSYMPELQNPMAYPIALMVMACLASSMVCYFRRTGWFD